MDRTAQLCYTDEILSLISKHDNSKGPFFIYAAYQAMHTPLEVPDKYLHTCMSITDIHRRTFCGMIQALNEGIGHITAELATKGVLDNTIIILSTDNGGQTAYGSSNWPLTTKPQCLKAELGTLDLCGTNL